MNRPARNGPETVQLAPPHEGANRERKRADWRKMRVREGRTKDRERKEGEGRQREIEKGVWKMLGNHSDQMLPFV